MDRFKITNRWIKTDIRTRRCGLRLFCLFSVACYNSDVESFFYGIKHVIITINIILIHAPMNSEKGSLRFLRLTSNCQKSRLDEAQFADKLRRNRRHATQSIHRTHFVNCSLSLLTISNLFCLPSNSQLFSTLIFAHLHRQTVTQFGQKSFPISPID